MCRQSVRFWSELSLGLRSNSFNIDSADIHVRALMCQILHCETLGGSFKPPGPSFCILALPHLTVRLVWTDEAQAAASP